MAIAGTSASSNGKAKTPAASALPLTAVPISRIFKTTDFGYQTITVERPERDEDGQPVLETKGKALAGNPEPADSITLFITWTTYGTWLPGDNRGWRKWKAGEQLPQPLLEDWCRDRMKQKPVELNESQRAAVEKVIREHATIRGWHIHAVPVRSNHIHVAVTAAAPPKRVRDQFKAHGTRVLREGQCPVTNEKVWTKGGDIEFIDSDDDLEQVVIYITAAQDRMDRGQ